MDIKTKSQLLEKMREHPYSVLYGNTGNRPASPWKYNLSIPFLGELTVSSIAVNAAMDDLRCCSTHWSHSKYKLKTKS